eukprot:TRINITY_DN13759_c0_g1_i1.p1 TRINITY_DN13759_c0_g1~~TRINITY_DN13759_c0_g1_i1.p1  ORF type:complete len:548 (+),score=34.49 TRINITY_DN13759_c0_g1_i1:169-1812(+)
MCLFTIFRMGVLLKNVVTSFLDYNVLTSCSLISPAALGLLNLKDRSKIYEEIKASVSQKQVYWLMLPMCDNKDDVKAYIDMIRHADKDWLVNHGALQIICETPQLLKNLDGVLSEIPEVTAVIVGAGDYLRFAQGSSDLLLPLLRWDILNACLRHQRLPIDTPTLNLKDNEELLNTFNNATKCGLRSGCLLHPRQVETANSVFSPQEEEVAASQETAQKFLESRDTGYRRSTGDDFHGPPHLKQRLWQVTYHAQINAKKVSTTKRIDKQVIKKTVSILEQSRGDALGDHSMLTFLSLATTFHPRHQDLVANLGFFNAHYADTENFVKVEEAAFVNTQLISHKSTSNLLHAISTYNVEILDKKFQPIFYVTIRLMEKRNSFEDPVCCEGDFPHVKKITEPIRDQALIRMQMGSAKQLIDCQIFFSPSEEIHKSYCALLRLDAPLHYTSNPTIPSVLHLNCHNLSINTVQKVHHVTYHAPMKPGTPYLRSLYQLSKTEYISVVEEGPGGCILSTVIFEEQGNMTISHVLTDVNKSRNSPPWFPKRRQSF